MNSSDQFQNILACLNSAVKADPTAMQALCCNRVPCNQALADHPLIPVDQFASSGYIIGAVGLLNGVLDAAKLPLVAMMFSDTTDEHGRATFFGFCEYTGQSGPAL